MCAIICYQILKSSLVTLPEVLVLAALYSVGTRSYQRRSRGRRLHVCCCALFCVFQHLLYSQRCLFVSSLFKNSTMNQSYQYCSENQTNNHGSVSLACLFVRFVCCCSFRFLKVLQWHVRLGLPILHACGKNDS